MLTQSEIRKKSRRVRDNHKAMSEKNILLVAIEFLGGSMILKVGRSLEVMAVVRSRETTDRRRQQRI